AEIGFQYGVKIGRWIAVAGVSGDEARWNVERAAECNREMRKIATHAGAVGEHVACRGQRRRRSDFILDVVAYPLANRLHAPVSRRDRAEFAACQGKQ